MSFSWIPDAELDPHPRLTWLAECAFDLTVLALYRKEEILPEDYKLEPGTLVISNHQRDSDVPILTTVLCQRRGLRIRWPLPFFASREDFFERGFLAGLLYTWPRALRWLLRGISPGWVFRIVRSVPMRRVREFTLAEVWRDLPEVTPEQALNERGRRELREVALARTKPVAHRFWGLRRLRAESRATLYPNFRATIDAQLERFAALLDAGRVVYFAPEGTISEDGRFGRVRAGVRRIAQHTATAPRILPVALSYDPLAAGRLRVITQVGTTLHRYNAQEGASFNTWVEMSIRQLYPVNASHLLSRFLVAGPQTFATEALANWFERARDQLAVTRCTLDPALAHADVASLPPNGWLG
ncbi:MAG: hypothetical protein L0H29_04860 [Sinobacteraceae bacterium]|nr:hypothetical protein [Nevskiaceae bacterium]